MLNSNEYETFATPFKRRFFSKGMNETCDSNAQKFHVVLKNTDFTVQFIVLLRRSIRFPIFFSDFQNAERCDNQQRIRRYYTIGAKIDMRTSIDSIAFFTNPVLHSKKRLSRKVRRDRQIRSASTGVFRETRETRRS